MSDQDMEELLSDSVAEALDQKENGESHPSAVSFQNRPDSSLILIDDDSLPNEQESTNEQEDTTSGKFLS